MKKKLVGPTSTDKLRPSMKSAMKNRDVKEPSKAMRHAVMALSEAQLVELIDKETGEKTDRHEDDDEKGTEKNEGKDKETVESRKDEDSHQKTKKRGGWPVICFKKRSWVSVQQNSIASEAAKRLRLSADSFDD